MNLILVWQLQHAGLALATSLAAYLNAGLLYMGLKRREVLTHGVGWGGFFVRLLVASTVMLTLLYLVSPDLSVWFEFAFWERMLKMTALCIAGALIYVAMLFVLGFRLSELRR